MDSTLMRLKGQVTTLGTNSRNMADALERLKAECGKTGNEIQRAIAGSSRQADRTILDTLKAAEKEVGEAAAALQRASHEANQFAASL